MGGRFAAVAAKALSGGWLGVFTVVASLPVILQMALRRLNGRESVFRQNEFFYYAMNDWTIYRCHPFLRWHWNAARRGMMDDMNG